MLEILNSKKVPVIFILFILISSGSIFITPATQASEVSEFPYPGDDWSWSMIGTRYAHQLGEKGDGVVIAVLDTGVDYTHPDLQDKMWEGIGYDFVNDNDDPMDNDGHGTHVAGIISSVAPNAQLMALKVIEEEGGRWQEVSEAIRFARNNGADIISMSFGAKRSPLSRLIEMRIDNAYSDGIFLTAAAGNQNTNDEYYPAAYNSVMAVSAIDSNKEKASYSNYGDWIELTAPGGDTGDRIISTVSDGEYGHKRGTSMACPYVAGAAALKMGAFPELSNVEVRETLWDEAIELEGPQEHFGYGLVNTYRAAGGTTPTPPRYLEAETGDGWVDISWEEPWDIGISEIDEYRLYRGISEDEMTLSYETSDVNQMNYLDEGVINDQLYYYYITAVNSEGESHPSEYKTVVPRESPVKPSEPRGLQIKETTEGVRLTWSAPLDDGGSSLTEYRIYRGTSADNLNFIDVVTPAYRNYVDKDLEKDTTYYYAVSAVNSEGESGLSEFVNLTTTVEHVEDYTITDSPPLPPRERESPIPFYEGDTILFILGVIVIAAVGWTGYIYYKHFKKVKERKKKKQQSGKKRY